MVSVLGKAKISPGDDTSGSPKATASKSRLLASMLDPRRLDTRETLHILDFGRANAASLEFFNQYPCRLSVLDAADTLLDWSASLESRMEEPPSVAQMQLELSGLLSTSGTDIGNEPFDLVFLWDALNQLHPHALPAFAGLLRRHITADVRAHGFLLHKRGTEQHLRHMSVAGAEQVAVQAQRPADLYAHNRKFIDETLEPDLRIDQGVLHGDGRLEYLMICGKS